VPIANLTPPDLDQTVGDRPTLGTPYELWLVERHNISNLEGHKNNYEIVTRDLRDFFQNCPFWTSLKRVLPEIDAEYAVSHKFPLVATFEPEILIKSWPSFLEKSYRQNISQNPNYPEPPSQGWCIPPEWYTTIHDIIRTTIVVKYIDGVPLMLDKLKELAETYTLPCISSIETREDGYYGAHFNLCYICEIPTMTWQKENRAIEFEIQITTQIKDVIKRLLHTYYASQRLSGRPTKLSDIAWNYREEEFVATYLGHILHYVEGMIIEVRDRRRGVVDAGKV
jgi:ppGpp synthetase/RelA/SpoT-type nucleotidyltranferase